MRVYVGFAELAVTERDAVGDVVSKCRTLAMVCVSSSVAKDKAMRERDMSLNYAQSELSSARAELARMHATIASTSKVLHRAVAVWAFGCYCRS